MSKPGLSDEFIIRWRFRRHANPRGCKVLGPATRTNKPSPTPSMHQVHVKARHVHEGSRWALLRHANYILDRDKYETREKGQETVEEFGDVVALARELGGHGNHYRIIIAPRRGDMLDMKSLLLNTVENVQKREGVNFKWAGVVHRMTEPNSVGVYNQHAHIIIEGGFGGSSMFKREFREAAREEASKQIDKMKIIGLHKEATRERIKEIQIDMREA